MERSAFLDRIRQATAAGRAYPVPINPLATETQSYVGGGEDPVATFLAEWRAVGGFGDRFSSPHSAFAYIEAVLAKHPAHAALTWEHPLLKELGLTDWLHQRGIRVSNWSDLEVTDIAQRKVITFGADVGFTSCDWAIAETGSLVMCSRPGGQGRSVSLLPPLHIAILRPSQILPDLFDVFQVLGEERGQSGQLPSNVVLITGPSKTGDIQLKLTTGVHGPGEVHAVVIE